MVIEHENSSSKGERTKWEDGCKLLQLQLRWIVGDLEVVFTYQKKGFRAKEGLHRLEN